MSEFIDYLYKQVNKAIYVWGAQGDNLTEMDDPISWIIDSETNTVNANRAIALYQKRKREGVDPILAFDCSGLIVYFLYDLKHAIPGDRNTKGLYAMSKKLASPKNPGDLVWYSKTGKPEDISHVGVYVGNGSVIEAKGRDDGVIETKLTDRTWTFAGHLLQLDQYLVDEEHPSFKVESPMKQGDIYYDLQKVLKNAGYLPTTPNGIWGRNSYNALKSLCEDTFGKPEEPKRTKTVEVYVDGILKNKFIVEDENE